MRLIGKGCALAILALPAVARADAGDIVDEYGVRYSVGAGFVQFAHPSMRAHATEGVGWEARVAFGTRKGLAVEVGYLGTLHDLDAEGLDSHANLLGSSLESVLRIPFASARLQPYALFGAGWGRYTITHTMTTTSEMRGTDHFVSYPLGAGLAYKHGEMVFDFRVVYRTASNIDLLPTPDARLDAWSSTLTVGVEF